MIPLFQRYPVLGELLPYTPLADLPTPVEKMERAGAQVGVDSLYIKRDDLTGRPYGGNKVRKLEFLLGDALRSGAGEVLTFGFAGSNHALATAIYARELGLKSISMLMPQPNACYVRRNLLMSHASGAELHHHRNMAALACATTIQMIQHTIAEGSRPVMIPPGGSSPPGAAGFVNAGLELADQIASGDVPEPDLIYVALGTTGTASGLMLGLRIAALRTGVVCVRVAPERFASADKTAALYNDTARYLRSLYHLFPEQAISEEELDIRQEFFGEGYAHFTPEGMEAVRLLKEAEGVSMEGTYTGKALACLLDDARKGKLEGKTVLFWNTYNSRDFSDITAPVDYHDLPHPFHRYFEEEVQPLDRQ